MTVFVLVGLIAVSFLRSSPKLSPVGFFFVGLEAVLSYFVAGIAKAASTTCQKECAVTSILRTFTYGRPAIAKWLEARPTLSNAAGWAVITFEVLFPLCLILPRPLMFGLLFCGLMFHLANALFMGLNLFSWAFVGKRPVWAACTSCLWAMMMG